MTKNIKEKSYLKAFRFKSALELFITSFNYFIPSFITSKSAILTPLNSGIGIYPELYTQRR